MLELFIDVTNNLKTIMLVENGKLIEKYEEEPNKDRLEGNIFLGIVQNVLPGMQAAFVDIGKDKNTFIHIRDVIPKVSNETGNKEEDFSKYNIKDYLKTKMPILVQVKKDSTNKKGARISSHLSIPGRFVVLMPNQKFITISQKINDQKERERLKEMVSKIIPEGFGAIIRTSAISKSEEELLKDINLAVSKYKKIRQTFDKLSKDSNVKPQLLYKSEDIVQRLITDLMDKDLYRICTNNKEVYDEVEKKLREANEIEEKINETDISVNSTNNANAKAKCKSKTGTSTRTNIRLELADNVLNIYDLEKQLQELEKRKIWLKCGGFITIDKTEALTAIDVNSGKYTGSKDLEQTIFTVNKEATIEIARQLRLRDIGGIIIIDYIDMKNKENEEKIIKLFEECLNNDRSKTQIVGFSKLNLLEMTRKHMCSND